MFDDVWSPTERQRGPLWIIAACFIGAAMVLFFLTPYQKIADLAIMAGCIFIIANNRSHSRRHP
jgi:energy-converting hydrogenase Eha subunit C